MRRRNGAQAAPPFLGFGQPGIGLLQQWTQQVASVPAGGHWSPRWAILGEPREEGDRPCGASHFNPILQWRSMWTLNCDFSFKNKKKRHGKFPLKREGKPVPFLAPLKSQHFSILHSWTFMLYHRTFGLCPHLYTYAKGLTTAAMTSFERSPLLRSLNLGWPAASWRNVIINYNYNRRDWRVSWGTKKTTAGSFIPSFIGSFIHSFNINGTPTMLQAWF